MPGLPLLLRVLLCRRLLLPPMRCVPPLGDGSLCWRSLCTGLLIGGCGRAARAAAGVCTEGGGVPLGTRPHRHALQPARSSEVHGMCCQSADRHQVLTYGWLLCRRDTGTLGHSAYGQELCSSAPCSSNCETDLLWRAHVVKCCAVLCTGAAQCSDASPILHALHRSPHQHRGTMGKVSKKTKKFVAKGGLNAQIRQRKTQQKVKQTRRQQEDARGEPPGPAEARRVHCMRLDGGWTGSGCPSTDPRAPMHTE